MSDEVKVCGDEVIVVETGARVRCSRSHGHPFVSFNDPKTRKVSFHEGDGYLWDERCLWKKGEEPRR